MAKMAGRIRELREEHDMTKIDLAKILGVNKSTITRYETGEVSPTIDVLIKMREYFGVTIDWLTGVDTKGEDKYTPAIKECMKNGISPDTLMMQVNVLSKAKGE